MGGLQIWGWLDRWMSHWLWKLCWDFNLCKKWLESLIQTMRWTSLEFQGKIYFRIEEQSEEWANGSEEGGCDLGVQVRRWHQRRTAVTEIRRLPLPNPGATTSPSSQACSALIQEDGIVLCLSTKETLVHVWCFTPVYARRSVPSLSVSRDAGVLKWHYLGLLLAVQSRMFILLEVARSQSGGCGKYTLFCRYTRVSVTSWHILTTRMC